MLSMKQPAVLRCAGAQLLGLTGADPDLPSPAPGGEGRLVRCGGEEQGGAAERPGSQPSWRPNQAPLRRSWFGVRLAEPPPCGEACAKPRLRFAPVSRPCHDDGVRAGALAT
jgi:hypothetical protein